MACIPRGSQPLVLRGSLTTFRRRCGKPTCHCASGEPHESPALVLTEGGRTKTVTLRDEEVPEVRAALARYQRARDDLEQAAEEGLGVLRARRAARRGGGRR